MLRGLFGAILFLLLALPSWGTTTVTGHISDMSGAASTSNTFVRFTLRGCAGNQPIVSGVTIFAPTQGSTWYKDFAADGSGNVSGTIYSTRDSTGLLGGEISCGGSTTAVWFGMSVWQGGKSGPEVPVHAKNGGTLNVQTVIPITSNPVTVAPTGDSTYLRLDAANSPVTGPLQITNPCNINGMIFVTTAGCYTTVQGAMTAANAAGGGLVLVPDGTYTGPTTWYSGVYVAAQHYSRPDLCIAALGAGCPSPAASSANVTFTYSASLTLTDLTKMGIVGITFDMTSSGNFTLAGTSWSTFDMSVINAAIAAPCATFTGSATKNGNNNRFPYFGCSGGNEGLKFVVSGGAHSFTVNDFGFVTIAELAAPVGTFTALDFASQCDTQHFQNVSFYSAQTAANGVVFNSTSTTVDNDANSIIIEYFFTTAVNFLTGTGITFNPSAGNYIKTGVLNWGNTTPCGVASVYCVATGGPVNSPNFTWITADATPSRTVAIFNQQINAQAANSSSVPCFNHFIGNALKWALCDGASDTMIWNNGTNRMSLDASGNLSVNSGGSVTPGSTAFASLGTPSNGRVIYCPDCNIANPCTGGGTGAIAKRLNGVWVCN